MTQVNQEDALVRERRLRLAAERKLEFKQQELTDANRQLSSHALSLSSKIVDQRKVVSELEGEKEKVTGDLEKAKDQVVIIERLLWDALESIPDGFALFDNQHQLITANRPYLQTLEDGMIQPGDDYSTILELCLDEGIVDLEGQAEDKWLEFMLNRWNAPKIEPITLRLWDRSFIKVTDLRRSDGGIVSMAMNITETILREVELREARDNAMAADRAKSAFLAKMSHELRTPMNGVVGMADLLLESDLDTENRLYASTIKSSGGALLDIINDVLDFSKVEAQKITLKPKPFDLEKVIQDVALILEPAIQQKNLQFSVDYDQFLPTRFIGDAGRVRQILTNLIGNAVKFTEQGHILVRVVGMESENAGTYQLNMTIEDTGIGIDDDKLDHVFGEFNQVEDDANRKYEGSGLGLAISRGLVEQMDGNVWVESTKGQGSCFGFQIFLPASVKSQESPLELPAGMDEAQIISGTTSDNKLLERQLQLLGIGVRCLEIDKVETCDPAEFSLVFVICDKDQDRSLALAKYLNKTSKVVLVGTAKHARLADEELPFLRKPILRQALHEVICALGAIEKPTQVDEPDAALLRVLAAEDNKTNQLVFKKMLKDRTLDLRLVENGVEVVDAFKQFRPDIVFMDISMPQMDGMEAAQKIRAFEAENELAPTPIIAMTAHALDGDEERIKQSGIDHYMTKPLKKDILTGHLDALAPLSQAS